VSNQHDQDRDTIAEAYTPREGDVIERGRTRIVVGHPTMFGGFFVTAYWRSWFNGRWTRIWSDVYEMDVPEFAALVNHMGWRLLPRSQEPPPGKPDDPTPKKSPCVR